MKRVLFVLAASGLIAAYTGCGEPTESTPAPSEETTQVTPQDTTEETAQSTPDAAEPELTLVTLKVPNMH